MSDTLKSLPKEISALEGPIAHDEELRSALGYRTVPMFFFDTTAADGPTGRGSGVLLHIGHRRFILTAGHCVVAARIALGVRQSQHRFFLESPSRNAVNCDGIGDFGYFEVAPHQVCSIEAGNRMFLTERSVEVLTVDELKQRPDFAVLGGYPKAYAVNEPQNVGAVLVAYSSNIESTGNAPSTPRPMPSAYESFDVWIPQNGNVQTRSGVLTPAQLESFAGASGGGWWLPGMGDLQSPRAWTPSSVRLIGTHQGRLPQTVSTSNGEVHNFARAALIGNHLALLATDYADLRPLILETWPQVAVFVDELQARRDTYRARQPEVL